jgi:hypothetical protein
MASSSNRYGLGALAEGIGAGAGALQSTQMNRAKISEARAIAGKAMQGIGFATIGGRDWAIMPDGSRMLVGEYLALPANKRPTLAGSAELPNIISGHPEWGQSSMPGQSATPGQGDTMAAKSLENMPKPHGEVPKFFGDIGRAQAGRDFAALMPLSDDQRAPQMEISKAVEANTIQDATSAYNQGGTLNQLTQALLKLPANEALSGGPLFDFKAGLLNKANDVIKTVASTLHMDPTQYLATTPEQNDALGWKAASDKLTGFLRIATTKGANQNSLGALDEVASMVPNSSLTRDQAAKILAGQYIDKQRALDRFNYLNEYKADVAEAHPGMSNMYLAQNADASFRKEHPDQEYGKAKNNIMQMLNTTMNDGNSLFYWVYSGKTKPETIDKLFKFPGFSRYVTNQ